MLNPPESSRALLKQYSAPPLMTFGGPAEGGSIKCIALGPRATEGKKGN